MIERPDRLPLKIMYSDTACSMLKDECGRWSRYEHCGKSTDVGKPAHGLISLSGSCLSQLLCSLNGRFGEPSRNDPTEPKTPNRARNCIRMIEYNVVAARTNR